MAEQSTGSLIAQAQQSRKLEETIARWPQLRGVSFSIGPLKGDKLKLFLGTPAALTRIKQIVPSLIQHLQSQGWPVQQVQLQIQTKQDIAMSARNRPKRAVFSEAAKKAWLDLEKNLDNPEILEATRALYRHHKLK
ncbi:MULTISPECIES: hypothetical protein [Limnobacter]|uniref:DUF721 domain-containing protein n=1 Tax=Limnobacter litoralis TaxID=481366 RepID=A0ABQ5YNB1_9BURK|nr:MULTISPECIES: hypothetical protein [Limnobacter]GLR26078.1 hypothetical protein GCM10007875_11660 [Limnobacter litoralis]HEX5485784.1 hypothetical protein [Limnobacter sp.]